jgi:hypothetical protein
MPKSSRSSLGGLLGGRRGGRSGGTVTVIEDRVHRSTARNAKLAFWVTTITVALLTATVLSDRMHPILALFAGIVGGAIPGAIVWAIVRVWPVVRLLWWWTPETLLSLGVVYGFTALARHTNDIVRLVVLAIVVGVPVVIPAVRRRLFAVAWCFIVRHRLRVCFSQFIIANRSGSLPLILAARPTPVGERVWIYLRTGLSLKEIQARADKIAVTCHARQITAEAASDRNAALIRIDIKRREVFAATVVNPLTGLVDPDTPERVRDLGLVPTALDLPDVTDPVANTNGTNGHSRPAGPQEKPTSSRKPSPTVTPAPVAVSADGEDISDYI